MYQNRVVAFIDILGFANLLQQTVTEESYPNWKENTNLVKALAEAFNRVADLMGVHQQPVGAVPSRQVTQFSDSLVISFLFEEKVNELRYLLEELIFLQVDLLRQQILIRGGISYGPLVHTENVLFGPAMVHAYQVESLAAISPRIILPGSLSNFTKDFEDLVSLDEDDYCYLDYFDKCGAAELAIFINDNEWIEHLTRTKEVIIDGLNTRDPGIYSKYGWMKSKWNKTIERHRKLSKPPKLQEFFENQTLIRDSM